MDMALFLLRLMVVVVVMLVVVVEVMVMVLVVVVVVVVVAVVVVLVVVAAAVVVVVVVPMPTKPVIVAEPEIGLALPFGVMRRGAAAGGAWGSPWAATTTAADVRPAEVARPERRKGPEVTASRRANLRASRRARRAPAAPAPTLTAFLCHPPCPGGGTHTHWARLPHLTSPTSLSHFLAPPHVTLLFSAPPSPSYYVFGRALSYFSLSPFR